MKKKLGITILVIGGILLIVGFSTTVPSREFSTYSIPAYYGGDAYNGAVEAGIRGGEIAGTTAAKSVYFGTGAFTVAIGLALIAFDYDEKKKEQALGNAVKTKKEETLQEVSDELPKI